MPRVILIADDETLWPIAVRPPADLVRADRFLKLHLRTIHEFQSLLRDSWPDVIHADGPGAIRAVSILSRFVKARPKILATGAACPCGGVAGWLTRRGLCNADRVIARSGTETKQYESVGVAGPRISRVPIGVAAMPAPDPVSFRRSLDIPDSGRLVVAAGRFDSMYALKSAVWAFDVVKYAAPDLYLVLIGDGPERERLARFSKALGFDDYRVRFTGHRDDSAALFGLAEVVWVTQTCGGVELVLSAMAAGRPVVAAKTPELAEVVEDGATARLVDPLDRVRLAAITNELLENPELAHSFAAAGQRRVAEQFPASEVGKRFADAYRVLASG